MIEDQKLRPRSASQYRYYAGRMLTLLGAKDVVYPPTPAMREPEEVYKALVLGIPVSVWPLTCTAWKRFCNWYWLTHEIELPTVPYKKPKGLSLEAVDGWADRKSRLPGPWDA